MNSWCPLHVLTNWLCQIDWSAVGSISTIALVFVTGYYAWSTHKILTESQRTREATQSLAESSRQSVQIMKQQTEQATAVARIIVASAINAARTNIQQWNTIHIPSYAVSGYIPENVNLVPLNAESAVQHAHLISPDGTLDLISGFENLRRASWELNFIRKFKDTANQTQMYKHAENAKKYIQSASVDLEAASRYFAEDIPSSSKKTE